MRTEYEQPEAQFSIYLIDFERVDEVEHLDKTPDDEGYFDAVIDIIERKVISSVQAHSGAKWKKITQNNYFGVVFSTTYIPMWKDLISQMLISGNYVVSNENINLLNVNTSYILLYHDEGNIFCMTGGYGSQYIRCFVDRNFGLDLLPKVLSEDDPVLRGILQNHLSGSLISSSTEHRNVVNFRAERDMSSVFRGLNIEISRTLAVEFGIPYEEGKDTPINLENKDSFVIRKSLNISELTNVLKRFSLLRKREDKFALNYLVEAKKVGIKNSDMFDLLCDQFSTGDIGDFIIIGENFADYLSKSSEYIVYDVISSEFFTTNTSLELSHVIAKMTGEGKHLSSSFMHEFFKKWKICTKDADGKVVLRPTPFFDAIQGHITTDKDVPVFLYNGKWHVIDQKYNAVLTKEFNHSCELYKKGADDINRGFGIIHKTDDPKYSETSYNKWLEEKKGIIVTHTVTMQNIEIADAILYNESTVYLLHNKGELNGEGCRDVLNQIVTSAYYLSHMRNYYDRNNWAREYYSKIIKEKKIYENVISEQEFIQIIINTKNIVYIAGYVHDYRVHTASNYAKFLTIDAERELSKYGFQFLSMGLTEPID